VKTIYPVYQGALVVCEGADSATVRLEIIRAVAGLTGLSTDKIVVAKMNKS
jgi:stage III sporulation protein AG